MSKDISGNAIKCCVCSQGYLADFRAYTLKGDYGGIKGD